MTRLRSIASNRNLSIALGENILDSRTSQTLLQSSQTTSAPQEDFSEYVAHLQLHMALQARNLVPSLTKTPDSREQLLHQTQAHFEKFASRTFL